MSDRETRLSENAWHLNEALNQVSQVQMRHDIPISAEEIQTVSQQLADLRNRCLTAPPPQGATQ